MLGRVLNSPYRWVMLLGLLGLALSIHIFLVAQAREDERLADHFDHLARDRVLRLQGSVDQALGTLNAVSGFFDASEEVNRAEFARMVAPLARAHPGIMAISWAPRVGDAQRAAHEARLRAEGFAPEGIFDMDANAHRHLRAPVRPVYFPITYSEPLARNRSAIGLDPYARPVHTQAMATAARTGLSWSSAPFPIGQDPGGPQAVAIFQPIFSPASSGDAPGLRQGSLSGYVILVLRLPETLERALTGLSPVGLDMRLVDETGRPLLLHHRPSVLQPSTVQAGEPLTQRLSLRMPGREWTVVLTVTEGFRQKAASRQAPLALLAGLGLTTLVCLALWGQAWRHQQQARLMARIAASEARLRQIFESNAAVKLIIDPESGRIVEANHAAVVFYGYPPETLLRMRIQDINTLPDNQIHDSMAQARDCRQQRFQFRHRLANGEVRDVEVYSGPIQTVDGTQLYSIIHDVTDRVVAERALRESEERFRQLAANIDSVFWINSPDWRQVYYISPAYERIWGRGVETLYAEGMDWLGAVLEEDRPALIAQLPGDRATDWDSIEFPPYRIRRPDGSIRWIAARAFAIRDERGRISRVAGIADDITERQEHQRHLEDLAHFDALTHLPNRLLLADRMRLSLARSRRTGQLLAICLLDLDGFKPINDRFGHDTGDRLLVQLANRLQDGVRGDDTVARLGGDEFVLLLSGLDNVKEVEEALERMLALIAQPYQIDDQQVAISASIGVTISPNDLGDADTLLRHADHAMYLAKQAGKNRYHLFNPILEHRERENRQAMQLISRAVDRDELQLYYQPIVDSRQGRVFAMEALLRWQHPVLGLLGPSEFLPLVEHDHALVVRIGTWVLRQALTQLRAWRAEGQDIAVSVNMFAQHLRDPEFPAMLEGMLGAFPDVPPDRLTLEILETAALEDMNGVITLIRFSEGLGMRFALDDFGTGYSSLTYLRRLPVHTLKIDQSFVRDMLQDPEDMTIVEGIIGLATAFRHAVVAEGVETADHALMLMEMGCHLVQGYGIARPMPARDTLSWLREFRPDPRWLANASKRLARDDHQLVLAEVYHRQWLAHLLAWGRAEATERGVPPPDDSQACNFGLWYRAEGTRRYGHLAPFAATGPIHEQVHTLARDYIRSVEMGDRPETQRLEAELLRQRNALLDALSRLRAAVMYTDAAQ